MIDVKISQTKRGTPLILELFSGTKSVGKVARRMGYNVISVDIDEKSKPDIIADILLLDYKNLPTPDFIWASPPCNSFSWFVCSNPKPSRDCKTYKAKTSVGRMGDAILKRTITIINHFMKKNPHLKYVIENPKAMMRLQPIMRKKKIATTSYCRYGFEINKPTDFFNNFNLVLLPVCTPKNPHRAGIRKHVLTQNIPLHERYKIPPKLIRIIFNQAFATPLR